MWWRLAWSFNSENEWNSESKNSFIGSFSSPWLLMSKFRVHLQGTTWWEIHLAKKNGRLVLANRVGLEFQAHQWSCRRRLLHLVRIRIVSTLIKLGKPRRWVGWQSYKYLNWILAFLVRSSMATKESDLHSLVKLYKGCWSSASKQYVIISVA